MLHWYSPSSVAEPLDRFAPDQRAAATAPSISSSEKTDDLKAQHTEGT